MHSKIAIENLAIIAGGLDRPKGPILPEPERLAIISPAAPKRRFTAGAVSAAANSRAFSLGDAKVLCVNQRK